MGVLFCVLLLIIVAVVKERLAERAAVVARWKRDDALLQPTILDAGWWHVFLCVTVAHALDDCAWARPFISFEDCACDHP